MYLRLRVAALWLALVCGPLGLWGNSEAWASSALLHAQDAKQQLRTRVAKSVKFKRCMKMENGEMIFGMCAEQVSSEVLRAPAQTLAPPPANPSQLKLPTEQPVAPKPKPANRTFKRKHIAPGISISVPDRAPAQMPSFPAQLRSSKKKN